MLSLVVVKRLFSKVLPFPENHQLLLAPVLGVLRYSYVSTADYEELVALFTLPKDFCARREEFLRASPSIEIIASHSCRLSEKTLPLL